MRIALIHYWLVNWRGGEQVLRALADLYPEADIFTHVADDQLVAEHFPKRNVYKTFISRLPGARKHYQKYLPLMPLALEELDLRAYDLVISSESGPAKGVITHPYSRHLCYCHSPMRYVWDMYHDYTNGHSRLSKLVFAPVLHYMRSWDYLSAQRVDAFAANSMFVSQRIKKYYRRESSVIYPPVAAPRLRLSATRDDFFLWVGQLVPYKRPDLMIDAFNQNGERLVVIGEGELMTQLRVSAKPNISFLGRQPLEVLAEHYSRCRALIFPGIEDFGMVPVEAMAAGSPVIALGIGGAKETVVDGITGILYSDNSASGLNAAVTRFQNMESTFKESAIRDHASSFSTDRFREEFLSFAQSGVS